MKQLFALEEFSAHRRAAQERYAAALRKPVTAALASGDFDAVLSLAARQYVEAYESDTAERLVPGPFNDFMDMLESALSKAGPDSDVEATALLISTAALNFAAIAASAADPEPLEMEWVDMDDDKVRKTHAAVDGQTRPPGVPFNVGGSDMAAPGDTRAPIAEWINCRCMLRPVAVVDRLRAALEGEEVERLLASLAAPRRVGTEALMAALRPIEAEGSIEISEELFGDAWERGIVVEVGLREDGAVLYDLRPDNEDDLADLRAALVASDSGDHSGDTSLVVVALPAEDDPVNAIGDEPKHVTLAYMSDFQGDPQAVHAVVENVLAPAAPFTMAVSGHGQLGPKGAKVLFVEAPELAGMRAALESDETVSAAMAGADAHPHFVPHMTIDYSDEIPEEAKALSEVNVDRLAIWQGENQTTYQLGLALPEGPPLADIAAALSDEQPVEGPQSPEDPIEPQAPADDVLAPADWAHDDALGIPVHGVLAPEGVPSGDGRGFREGSLTNRPLPLPMTWQERTAEGHDDAAVVVVIEKIEVIDGLQHWSGHMRQTEDADKALGLLVDFGGRYGVSIDGDSVVGDGDYDENDVQWFSEVRTSGASMVNIPAYPEAYIALGPHPVLDAPETEDVTSMDPGADEREWPDETDDAPALVAGGAFLAKAVQLFKDLAPGKTEDGPGWLTHPVDTDRLRDYWVRGEGAAKIAWGAPGDFNRCRVNLAEYIKPEFLNGYCANRHYDALGVWPGREGGGGRHSAETLTAGGAAMAPALTITAGEGGGWCAPSEWFEDPKLDKPTGVVITPEGRTYGHIAIWGECHIGLPGVCTAPPTSDTAYAYFKTGMVPTREGGFAEVGQLTVGGGHADDRLGYRGAVAHYDNTCSVWADVNVGEDEHGIWFAGSVRPGISEDLLYAARASGRLSGDWRDIHNNLELCGALSINVAGFPIPKVGFAVERGRQITLVAAGIVQATAPSAPEPDPDSADVTSLDPRVFAAAVIAALDERETIKTLRSDLEKQGV